MSKRAFLFSTWIAGASFAVLIGWVGVSLVASRVTAGPVLPPLSEDSTSTFRSKSASGKDRVVSGSTTSIVLRPETAALGSELFFEPGVKSTDAPAPPVPGSLEAPGAGELLTPPTVESTRAPGSVPVSTTRLPPTTATPRTTAPSTSIDVRSSASPTTTRSVHGRTKDHYAVAAASLSISGNSPRAASGVSVPAPVALAPTSTPAPAPATAPAVVVVQIDPPTNEARGEKGSEPIVTAAAPTVPVVAVPVPVTPPTVAISGPSPSPGNPGTSAPPSVVPVTVAVGGTSTVAVSEVPATSANTSPATTTPPPSTSPAVPTTVARTDWARTLSIGSVGLHCSGNKVILDFATPNAGVSVKASGSGTDEMEITFKSNSKEAAVHAKCPGGRPQVVVEEGD